MDLINPEFFSINAFSFGLVFIIYVKSMYPPFLNNILNISSLSITLSIKIFMMLFPL